jgi:hypothetical protein
MLKGIKISNMLETTNEIMIRIKQWFTGGLGGLGNARIPNHRPKPVEHWLI